MSAAGQSGFRLEDLPNGYRVGRHAALERIPGAVHVVTTRHGPNFWPVKQGDDAPLRMIAEVLGVEGVAYARHVHGADILPADRPGYVGEADGLVTRRRSLAIAAFGADCVDILAVDPVGRSLGAVHAGWRGTVARAARNLIRAMAEHCGSAPADVIACLGPSIGPCCFFMGQDALDAARRTYGAIADSFFAPSGEWLAFDLWAANVADLVSAGLKRENVHPCGICTSCRTDEFFSYQKERLDANSCSAVALVPEEG